MHTLHHLRESFLEFFKENNHELIPSSPLVPHHDPSLMFTNAGMVPFKNVFSGAEKIHNKKGVEIKRAASSQKCVRAGGKHNDLDNVGYTSRHHTFFEMLGNFSFGDYFKEGAIDLAWKFLTKTLEIPKEKLYVTVYHTDEEAYALWTKMIGLSGDRVIRIATQDNFWAMGDTGPCGPCSEIFYDHGDKIQGGLPGTKDADGDRYVEIWNLVFMQFEKLADGKQINLPKPCIDTGMGLERIATVMQGVHDNYEIDLFKHLIEASQHETRNNKTEMKSSHRVIADHLRSMSFLIADGVLPSNEGRGYVLRRIMRRGMRHAHLLGTKDPVIYKLVPTLVNEMGQAYPELKRAESLIVETVRSEEERFGKTFAQGLVYMQEAIKRDKNVFQRWQEAEERKDKDRSALSRSIASDIAVKLNGEEVFKLHDTYGFPKDLTESILLERGIGIDDSGFDKAMQEQKQKARLSWKGSGDTATNEIWFDLKEQFGGTEFLGYQTLTAHASLQAIIVDGKVSEHAHAGDNVMLLVNQTPFYGESGGQAGDHGEILGHQGVINITNTLKILGSLHVHVGTVERGIINKGETVELKVDGKRRASLRANHSATHLLHAVLRKHLGDHVTQKGSLVEADYFRFDFSHPKALSSEEIDNIEAEVNRLVRENTAAETRLMKTDEAIKAGAMALFGEKYGDEVRVVNMGEDAYSIELCGGTHVSRTGDIGIFRITSQSSVAAGVRRIEAVTAETAFKLAKAQEQQLLQASEQLKTTPNKLLERVSALVMEKKKLEQEISDLRKAVAMGGGSANDNADDVETIAGIKFIAREFTDIPAKDLKGLVDDCKKKIGSGIVAITSVAEGKVSLVVGVTDDITSRINAVDLVKKGAEVLGGKGGGGRPDMAQAGGVDASKVREAFAAIKNTIR